MFDDTDSLCGCRLVAVGETGRGAELEPDVDGREKTESVGEGGGSEHGYGFAQNTKSAIAWMMCVQESQAVGSRRREWASR